MKKVEEICQKFSSLKNILNESNIEHICNIPFNSLTKEIKRTTKEEPSLNNLETMPKNNQNITNSNKSSNKNDINCFKNLLISLESSKKTQKNTLNINKSPKIEKSRSPSINKEDESPKILNNEEKEKNILENDINNEIKSKIIPLNEDEEENNESSSYKIKSNKNLEKTKSNQNISFYIIDKTDKNLNISDKIKEFLNIYDDKLISLSKDLPQIKLVDNFFYKTKESLIMKYIRDNNIISIDTIKKLVHLCFNVLSKVFSVFTKETENKINSCLIDINEIITLILNFIKLIKKFINNNSDNVDVTFLKEMKNIGNYCLHAISLKKYNYEYMADIENKNENEKKIDFFKIYMKYFKIIGKIKPIFKENSLFMKHFMVQPSMIGVLDLIEMNRKIINFQLNVNYKM